MEEHYLYFIFYIFIFLFISSDIRYIDIDINK
jgi:hypothetical protein